MRLLSLCDYAQKQVVSGKISQGHAKVLVGLDEKKQKIIIDSIIGQKLSVRDAEKMVKNHKENVSTVSLKPSTPHLLEKYAKELETALPFKHKIKAKSIEISLTNEKDIENFLIFLKKH
jgi:ParB family chromosome partitioning protein